MKTPLKVLVCSFLLTGCASHNPTTYQQRVASVTRQNASYVSGSGYSISKYNPKTGFIVARAPLNAKPLENLNFHYQGEGINPYVADNGPIFTTQNKKQEVICSVTSYWTGKN
jgi:hypothetical protein